MQTPVLFLDGELYNVMLFGIPEGSFYRHPIPPYDIEVGGTDEYPEIETVKDEIEEYQLIQIGHYVRIGALNKELLKERDMVIFKLCETIYKLESMMPRAMFRDIFRERPIDNDVKPLEAATTIKTNK